jgi:hypothetical protein
MASRINLKNGWVKNDRETMTEEEKSDKDQL